MLIIFYNFSLKNIMKISGLYTDTHIIRQEGGISIDECVKMFQKDNVPSDILKECNFNLNDPDKKSTKCRKNQGKISYNIAKEVFEKYYNEINTTDSGRLRGKMFDIKYNKKNKDLLYPEEPCSEKYLEPEGPKKYDMWLVDSFPEAESVAVDKGVNIATQYYSPDDNISGELKYGPMITYGHLYSKNYNEFYEEYLKQSDDPVKSAERAERDAIEKTSNQLRDNQNIRLFNQYFSQISVPTWLKDYKDNLVRAGYKPIYDLNSPEFKQSIIEARRKRDSKIKKRSIQPTYSPNPSIESKVLDRPAENKTPDIDIPTFDIDEPDIAIQPQLTIEEVFKQPEITRTDEGPITTLEEYRRLFIVDISENISLFNKDTNLLYRIPMTDDYLETNDYETIENFFIQNIQYIFDLLEKPITPFAILTYNGIKDL
jgi:hypothetical protein